MSDSEVTMKVDNDGATPRFERRVLSIAGVAVLGAVMTILDTSIVAVAINTLSRDFGVSLPTIQWVSTTRMLALAAVRPPYVANAGRPS
jgi:MFS family permease